MYYFDDNQNEEHYPGDIQDEDGSEQPAWSPSNEEVTDTNVENDPDDIVGPDGKMYRAAIQYYDSPEAARAQDEPHRIYHHQEYYKNLFGDYSKSYGNVANLSLNESMAEQNSVHQNDLPLIDACNEQPAGSPCNKEITDTNVVSFPDDIVGPDGKVYHIPIDFYDSPEAARAQDEAHRIDYRPYYLRKLYEDYLRSHCNTVNWDLNKPIAEQNAVLQNDLPIIDVSIKQPAGNPCTEETMETSAKVIDCIGNEDFTVNHAEEKPTSTMQNNTSPEPSYIEGESDVAPASSASMQILDAKISNYLKKADSAFQFAKKFLVLTPTVYSAKHLFTFDFQQRYYREVEDEVLANKVFHMFEDDIMAKGSPAFVNQIVRSIKMICDDNEKNINKSNSVVFRNGVLDLEQHRLLPFNSIFFTTYRIEANYIPDPQNTYAPTFQQMLYSISGGDLIMQQRLREILGYLLVPLGDRKKLILFQGVTNSGKSTLINFITAVLSPNSVFTLDAGDFSKQFSLANLPFKALCVSPDMPSGSLKPEVVSKIKQLTGFDAVSTDVKYQNRQTFRNTAKLVFVTNHAFYTKADDSAFFDRIAVMPFYKSFSSNEVQPDLLDKLLAERDAIVTQCVNAYMQLPINAPFTGSDLAKFAPNQAVNIGEQDVESSIVAFVKEYFVKEPDGLVFNKDAHSLFCENFFDVPIQRFSPIFKAAAESMFNATCSRKRRGDGGNSQHCILGLALRSNQQS